MLNCYQQDGEKEAVAEVWGNINLYNSASHETFFHIILWNILLQG